MVLRVHREGCHAAHEPDVELCDEGHCGDTLPDHCVPSHLSGCLHGIYGHCCCCSCMVSAKGLCGNVQGSVEGRDWGKVGFGVLIW